jgi:hypothetical protein
MSEPIVGNPCPTFYGVRKNLLRNYESRQAALLASVGYLKAKFVVQTMTLKILQTSALRDLYSDSRLNNRCRSFVIPVSLQNEIIY